MTNSNHAVMLFNLRTIVFNTESTLTELHAELNSLFGAEKGKFLVKGFAI